MTNADRRTFLISCLGSMATAAAALVAYPIYRYLAPLPLPQVATKVVMPETEVTTGKATFFQFAGSAAVLIKKPSGEIIALSAVCTHLGCIVQWQNDLQQLLCPCHAGKYTAEGAVISGPPPKPLVRLPVSVANGTITIG